MKHTLFWKLICATFSVLWMAHTATIVAEQECPPYAIMGMLNPEIASQLPGIKELNPELYKVRIDLPKETIYEMVGEAEGLGWTLAVADITQSAPHFHRYISETYIMVTGVLEVTIDDKQYVMHPGDVIVIPANAVHSARSLTDEPARILVPCVPGWTPKDHNLVTPAKEDVCL